MKECRFCARGRRRGEGEGAPAVAKPYFVVPAPVFSIDLDPIRWCMASALPTLLSRTCRSAIAAAAATGLIVYESGT